MVTYVPNVTLTFSKVDLNKCSFQVMGLNVNITKSKLSQMLVYYDEGVEFENRMKVYFHNSSIITLIGNPINLYVSDVDIRHLKNLSMAIFTLQNSYVHVLNSVFADNHVKDEIKNDVPVSAVVDVVVGKVFIQNSTFIGSSWVASFDRSNVEILD